MGLIAVGAVPVPDDMADFWKPFLIPGCFTKPYYEERDLVLPQLEILFFVDTRGRPALFLNRNRDIVDWEKAGRG